MCTEIRKLRYCYNVLQRRIQDRDEGLAYWQMNFKIATYFLKRYDAQFDTENFGNDEAFLEDLADSILKTHPLLQRPTAGKKSYPRLTEELETQLKQRVARYFDSIDTERDQA